MQFGIQLPTYWPDYGASTVQAAIEEVAQDAAALGFTSLWANDHVITSGRRPDVGSIIEPLVTLASLIHLTPHVQLGTSVLVLPQRNAIVIAKQAAALHILSRGRFLLGVGVGWNADEFRFLNADFAQRGAVADEAITVMRALWQDTQPSYEGEFYRFTDARFAPKPPGGGPPLWIGGNTAVAIRRTARVGDAWSPFGIGLDDYKAGVASLRTLCKERNLPLLSAHMMLRILQPGEAASSALARTAHIAGRVEEVVEQIARYREAGLAYLVCGFVAQDVPDFLRQMRTLARHVL